MPTPPVREWEPYHDQFYTLCRNYQVDPLRQYYATAFRLMQATGVTFEHALRQQLRAVRQQRRAPADPTAQPEHQKGLPA